MTESIVLEKQIPSLITPPKLPKKSTLSPPLSLHLENQYSIPYSLFNSPLPSNWPNYCTDTTLVNPDLPITRKHSISADGSDSPSYRSIEYENNYAAFWRRPSLLTSTTASSTNCCSMCLYSYKSIDIQFYTNCNHSVCSSCLPSSVSNKPLNFLNNGCPICLMLSPKTSSSPHQLNIPLGGGSDFFSSGFGYGLPAKAASYFYSNNVTAIGSSGSFCNQSPDSYSPSLCSQQDEELFYIGDLLSPSESSCSLSSDQFVSSLINTYYSCVKVSNIPWDVSQNDIRNFFKDFQMPSSMSYAQPIHIMMDRLTGKTLSDCYIEFVSDSEALRAIKYGNQRVLKGRILSARKCSSKELLRVVFPKLQTPELQQSLSNDFSSISNGGGVSFVSRKEINSLLVICKNYKLHFSRKCAERPFENIISIVTKYPWHQSELIHAMHRDHIYELLKLSIESLKVHLSKEVVHIDKTLLERMVRTGIMCTAFTERQKSTLLYTAKIKCPADIESYMCYGRPDPCLLPDHTQKKEFTTTASLQELPMATNDICFQQKTPTVAIVTPPITNKLLDINNDNVNSLLDLFNTPSLTEKQAEKSTLVAVAEKNRDSLFDSIIPVSVATDLNSNIGHKTECSEGESDEQSYYFCEDDENESNSSLSFCKV